MDIYYLCPCCNKKQRIINPLTLGSSWQDEMYRCLETYLKTLQKDVIDAWKPKSPKLTMGLDTFEGEQKKIPYSLQVVYVPPKERGEPIKKKTKLGEAVEEGETVDPTWKLWGNISKSFKLGEMEEGEALTESQVKYRIGTWTARAFTRSQVNEWLKVGFFASEAELAEFCRDILGIEPDDAVNFYSKEEIVKMYNKQKGIADEEDVDTEDREDWG